MKLIYPACFYPLEKQDGFLVEFPDLQGCVTQGDNMAHAIEMATDAASGWLLDEFEDGNHAPPPTDIKLVTPDEPDGIVSLIVLDMDSYAEKYGDKAIRKNLTIPAWLATFADKNNVNYSQILQNALITELRIEHHQQYQRR
ncbi:MAG: type II toxin-antitoxin system HicB family antitoxin [Oscillospiraceae bacterium]|nr:type II toxin-antitoxin system HicB family antitoxin [Oscillospiraceae bacterium]